MKKQYVAAGVGALLAAALAVGGVVAVANTVQPTVAETTAAEPASSTPKPSKSARPDDAALDEAVADESPVSEAAPAPVPAPAAPVPVAAPAPAPAAPAASTAEQQTALNLVNERRAADGLGPVAINGSLSQAAAVQAQYQAATLTMTHDGNGGLAARVGAAGYGYCWVGENVAAGQRDAGSVHTAWVNSPGHLANILQSTATDMGLASAVGSNGTIYWAQVFGTRC